MISRDKIWVFEDRLATKSGMRGGFEYLWFYKTCLFEFTRHQSITMGHVQVKRQIGNLFLLAPGDLDKLASLMLIIELRIPYTVFLGDF